MKENKFETFFNLNEFSPTLVITDKKEVKDEFASFVNKVNSAVAFF